jgi:hypothetical protein
MLAAPSPTTFGLPAPREKRRPLARASDARLACWRIAVAAKRSRTAARPERGEQRAHAMLQTGRASYASDRRLPGAPSAAQRVRRGGGAALLSTCWQLAAALPALLKPGGFLYVDDFFHRGDKLTVKKRTRSGKTFTARGCEEILAVLSACGFRDPDFQDVTPKWQPYLRRAVPRRAGRAHH